MAEEEIKDFETGGADQFIDEMTDEEWQEYYNWCWEMDRKLNADLMNIYFDDGYNLFAGIGVNEKYNYILKCGVEFGETFDVILCYFKGEKEFYVDVDTKWSIETNCKMVMYDDLDEEAAREVNEADWKFVRERYVLYSDGLHLLEKEDVKF